MSLLQNTVFAAVFLIPGALSLALALCPKGRAVRQSRLSTRAFGLLLFAVVDWILALSAYSLLVSDGGHGETIAILVSGADEPRNEKLAELLLFPPQIWAGIGLLVACILATGFVAAVFQSASLTGMAIDDFRLARMIPKCRPWWRRWRARFSWSVGWTLKKVGITTLFQPLGAGYWLVILRAARILQSSEPKHQAGTDDPKVPRVYADVIQGDELIGDNVGILYKGTVKHLVCETDGNIVFLLLTEASRWRGSRVRRESRLILRGGEMSPPAVTGPWKQIEHSAAFALEGRSIRNINFRLIDRYSVPAEKKRMEEILFGDVTALPV